MAGTRRIAQGIAIAGMLLACAAPATAQTPLDGPVLAGERGSVGLSVDLNGILPRLGAGSEPNTGYRRPLSPAAALPDPRALKGSGSRGEEARLRLNLKGFSLLEMKEDAGTSLTVRRVREREMRKPALSLTFQKRF